MEDNIQMSTFETTLFFIILAAVCVVVIVLSVNYGFKERKRIEANRPALKFRRLFFNTSLDEIWEIADQKDFLIAMHGWLQRKVHKEVESGGDRYLLSPAESTAFDVLTFDNLVYAHGFYDFWLGLGRSLSCEFYESQLRAIGAESAADLWHDAVSLIISSAGNGNPFDPILDNPKRAEGLSVLDSKYLHQSDEVNDKVYQYIQLHKSEFSE